MRLDGETRMARRKDFPATRGNVSVVDGFSSGLWFPAKKI